MLPDDFAAQVPSPQRHGSSWEAPDGRFPEVLEGRFRPGSGGAGSSMTGDALLRTLRYPQLIMRPYHDEEWHLQVLSRGAHGAYRR